MYPMKALKYFLTLLILIQIVSCAPDSSEIKSPDNSITVDFYVEKGEPGYRILKNNQVVLDSSELGMLFDGADLSKNLELVSSSSISSHSDVYEMLHGKQKMITYEANEKSFSLVHGSGVEFDVVFRVSDDGVGFRYEIKGEGNELHYIDEEFTSFNFPDNSKAWLQHMANAKTGFAQTNPSYEEDYQLGINVGTAAPDTAGWVYPALFEVGRTWVLITETGLDGTYPGTKLAQFSEGGNYKIDFPQWGEQYPGRALDPQSTLPWKTPWRIITIGDLETITESTLGTDLADPEVETNTEWINPGRAAWSWAKLKDESVNYDTQKEFIDYASEMGWEYVLVDVNWDQNIGYERIKELVDYARPKGVGLILWYNSSGDWNETEYTPKSALVTREKRRAEFSKIQEIGIKGVKVDFFAGDGQSMIQYYLDIFQDAADHQLLVNTHGSTIPRGWHRTWPNLMTMESVKGFEFVTFFQPNADREAVHSAMLPFTRNVFDPMDFTPMSPTAIPNIERKTTPAFQIAQPVIFTSGIQHFAETPEGMDQIPDFVQDFVKEIPVIWDEMEFVDGYPSEYVIFARRQDYRWFVAGINAKQESMSLSLDLSFIPDELKGTMITDGEGESMFTEESVSVSKAVSITMKPTGGFVMLFE